MLKDELFINIEAGLLLQAKVTPEGKFVGCAGKTAKIEQLEFDCYLIDQDYYQKAYQDGTLTRIVRLV
jgi:hypothetical protein